jgi:aminopeptidase N
MRIKITILLLTSALCFPAFAQSGETLLNLAKSEMQHRHGLAKSSLQLAAVNGDNIDVIQYRAHWMLNPETDSIKGKVAVVFRPKAQPVSQTSLDFASNMVVESVRFRNVPVQFSFAGASTLNLNFGNQQLNPGNTDSLVIRYRGKPNSTGLGSFNRYQHAGTWLIYTLSEPYGAKDWWPCKQSLSDKADSIDITLYTPSSYTAVANGMLQSQGEAGGIKTFRWKHKYPIATYLVAVASTNYVFFKHKAVLASGDTLPVENYCYPENLAQWQTGMAAIVPMIEDFDTLLAPYPFPSEKYGHTQFAFGGGMEHQTNSFMQNTDYGLQAHELAHQWFGNKITCHSWEDIWLNEGFATYLAAMEYVKAGFSSWPQEGSQWINFITSEPGGSVFCSDTTDVFRIFNGRLSYAKGAMLLRMLRWKTGDQAFWQGVRNYIGDTPLAYGFARTSDFRSYMESSYGQSLSEFFNDWYKGEGHPQVQVEAMIDTDSVRVSLFQQPSHPSVSFFEMDVPLKIIGGTSDTLVRLPFSQNGQTYTIRTGFIINSIEADPEKQWLAKWNVSQVTGRNAMLRNIPAMFFPNPFRDQLIYRTGSEKVFSATLCDMNGKTVLPLSCEDDMASTSVAVLPPGTYLLRTETSAGVQHRLFLKE